eukprot:4464605-Pleurochrysis_carterae.AAC.1
MRERHDEALRLRPLGLQRNLCTDLIEPYDGRFDPTRPSNASPPKVSPKPSDGAMVRELERVERELRERDRAELAKLREQVAALAASQERPRSPAPNAQQHQSASRCVTPADRMPNRVSLTIALNVAVLCAAIAIGAMQLLDNGAQPHNLFKLCVL